MAPPNGGFKTRTHTVACPVVSVPVYSLKLNPTNISAINNEYGHDTFYHSLIPSLSNFPRSWIHNNPSVKISSSLEGELECFVLLSKIVIQNVDNSTRSLLKSKKCRKFDERSISAH